MWKKLGSINNSWRCVSKNIKIKTMCLNHKTSLLVKGITPSKWKFHNKCVKSLVWLLLYCYEIPLRNKENLESESALWIQPTPSIRKFKALLSSHAQKIGLLPWLFHSIWFYYRHVESSFLFSSTCNWKKGWEKEGIPLEWKANPRKASVCWYRVEIDGKQWGRLSVSNCNSK